MEDTTKDLALRCRPPPLITDSASTTLGSMRSNPVQLLEGRQVCVALRNGSRIDDCQLVSAGRISTDTFWLFSNGADLFVSVEEVLDVWEAPATTQAA